MNNISVTPVRDLDGSRAIVTGAGNGIGLQTALELAARGAEIFVSDIDGTAMSEAVHLIEQTGAKAGGAVCDVSDEESVEAMVSEAVAVMGGLDLSVNNAGVDGELASVAKQRRAEWDHVIGVNLTGVFLGMKYALPHIIASGGGAIVNISSIAGQQGFPGMSPYVASKHGVIGLTRSAAAEYGSRGIRVNAVCPGYTDTAMAARTNDAASASLQRRTPLGRIAGPSEMATAIAFLLSPAASYITGVDLVVDGGMTMAYS